MRLSIFKIKEMIILFYYSFFFLFYVLHFIYVYLNLNRIELFPLYILDITF